MAKKRQKEPVFQREKIKVRRWVKEPAPGKVHYQEYDSTKWQSPPKPTFGRFKQGTKGEKHGRAQRYEDYIIARLDRHREIARARQSDPELVHIDPETASMIIRSQSTHWLKPRKNYFTPRKEYHWPVGVLSEFTPKQKQAWILLREFRLSKSEAAQIMGISRERVRQLEEAAKLRIKRTLLQGVKLLKFR